MRRQIPFVVRAALSGSLTLFTGLAAMPAWAQSAPPAATPAKAEASADQGDLAEVVVTGSRIRRTAVDTPAPVTVVDQQLLTDRGFVSAAQALNQVTSINPQLNLAPGNGASSGSGQQFPALFGLGAGRTLTLVNGRRFVTSSNGLGDSQVDANTIPTGLLERVEIVQAGGAAVYGSDAVGGVVNYILKKNFTGLELDAQVGDASRGDFPVYSGRATYGVNFADGRGNIAANVEWAKSPTLTFADRPLTNLARITQSNPADTGPTDGIPSVRELFDARFWEFNRNGVIFTTPAPVPTFLARLNGSALQFAPNGDVIPYDTGTILGVPFATGGEGYRFSDLAGLRTGVERLTGNVIGHYDLTDNVKLTGEFLYATTDGTETPQGESRTILNSAASNAGAIAFTRNNPFLSASAIASLSAARPQFAAGAPLFLSKYFDDFLPDPRQTTSTDTYRAVLGLEGDLQLAQRDYYWTVSASHARVEGGTRRWRVVNSRYSKAIAAVRNTAGQIVCAVNADADATNDDAACVPINPFGNGNVGAAAASYLSTLVGTDYTNKQTDLLATLGGNVMTLPGGDAKFSVAYEHRAEDAEFVPLPANQQGLFDVGTREIPQSGKYNTNEFSAELLVPVVGDDFTLPLVKELELSGAFRMVDNSIAGNEDVWNLGLRWLTVEGFTLRGSVSRNFRAPTLTQLFAPSSTALGSIAVDPCDADRINSGPNPAARRANCAALFAANPSWGALATFQDPSENFTRALITTGGNSSLRNEVSDTITWGFVLQPAAVPGLTFVADRIEVKLKDGLSAFTTQDFAATCFDTTPQPTEICNSFTRLAASDGTNPGGTIITGRTTTFNAGIVKYHGEVYNLSYNFPLGALFSDRDLGRLELALEATHNTLLVTSVTGTTFVRTDDTVTQPTWVGRFDMRYSKGPLRLTYQLGYLDETRAGPNATIESTPVPIIASNLVQNVSAQYDFGQVQVRAGINNLMDKQPSYPVIGYGDIIGRQAYLGIRTQL
jgi:iron complex outermembrane recepter protein